MAPRSPILRPVNPSIKNTLTRGLLWAALGLIWVVFGTVWLCAAVLFGVLTGLEKLRDRVAEALGLEADF